MKWSKIKKRFESQLPDYLQGRLNVHVAGYRYTNQGRGWIVLDGVEIVSVESPGFTMKVGNCQLSIFSSNMTWELGSSIFRMMNIPIGEALNSINPLIRGLALIDKRINNKQVKDVKEKELSPFEKVTLGIYEFAKGINYNTLACPRCGKFILPNNK